MILHILNAICTAVPVCLLLFQRMYIYIYIFSSSSTPFVKTNNLQREQKEEGNRQNGYQDFTHKQMASFVVSLGREKALDKSSVPLQCSLNSPQKFGNFMLLFFLLVILPLTTTSFLPKSTM